MIHEIDHLGKQ